MNFRPLAALAVAAAIVVSGCKPKADPAAFETHAQSMSYVAGSLCTGGDASFDCQASKVLTRIATSRFKAAAQLSEGTIDRDAAIAAQSAADNVRTTIDIAIAECKVSGKTGECTAQSDDAHQRLAQAQAAAGALK